MITRVCFIRAIICTYRRYKYLKYNNRHFEDLYKQHENGKTSLSFQRFITKDLTGNISSTAKKCIHSEGPSSETDQEDLLDMK